jgi:hypothetical protein
MAFNRVSSGENGPSAVQALERLADGAQGVVRDQLELARIDARDAVLGSLSGASAAVVGAIFFLVGWVALSMAAYTLLLVRLAPWSSFAAVAAVNLALGAGATAWGIARMRNPRGI